ncbi:MAG: hypothetical protein AAGK14_00190 [Verrucomicrobiota bacterium]
MPARDPACAVLHRKATNTLTAVELNHGETLCFERRDATRVHLRLVNTGAEIVSTTLNRPGIEERKARTVYRFWADLEIGGSSHRLVREVGTPASFYEPWELAGLRLWLDAVDAVFDFMNQTHGLCRPRENCSGGLPERRACRLAVQDAALRICPETLHPWCPLPPGGLRIEDCYRGEDCWLGAYDGASAHAGLDINHPSGTPLYAPFDLDRQHLFHRLETGHNNNRWRGFRRWNHGEEWILESSHMTEVLVAEDAPLRRGERYAFGAGVNTWDHEHSHFGFTIYTRGELIPLDPWILFWQMYRDQEAGEEPAEPV